MIEKITIENFKCFKNNIEFPLSKINLLTGTNSCGKSTLLQTMLLMKQSITHHQFTSKILFNGDFFNYGSFEEIRNSDTTKTSPIIFQFHSNKEFVKYVLVENIVDDMVADIKEIEISQDERSFVFMRNQDDYFTFKDVDEKATIPLINLFPLVFNPQFKSKINASIDFHSIHYVSANRSGPKDFYYKSNFPTFINVGARGDMATNILLKLKEYTINDEVMLVDKESPNSLSNQAELWISKIFSGAKVEVRDTDNITISLLLNSDSSSKHRYKPVNVGFGYSYILPIVVSGLIAKKGDILIVENPEAHLHPRAQSEITGFLLKVAQKGVQVFIESHSDHVLNRIRVETHKKIVSPKDLNIMYFDKTMPNYFRKIEVDEKGGISDWPIDFFDQATKDLNHLFGI